MTLLAPTAPLLTIRHDWADPVELVPSFPSRVLTSETGTEQRLALSQLASTVVTYRLLAPTYGEAAALKTLLDAATDALVRVPRWEDEARVSTETSGSTIPCDPSDKPTFVSGAEVLLWRSATEYEVAVIDVVSGSDVSTVDPLVSVWAPGTIVVPISEARVQLPLSLTHWVPTSGALSVTFEVGLRDLAGLGTGGTATTTTVDTLTLALRGMSATPRLRGESRAIVVAYATDAAGDPVVNVPIVWTSTDSAVADIYASADPMVAVVHAHRGSAGFTGVDFTGTVGAVSDSVGIEVWG